ncbi:MAG: ribosome small subunit-dependent GTPase A [Bacteroidia bacterium]
MKALVIRSTGSFASVITEDGRQVECKVKGIFRKTELRTTNPIAVGDKVKIDESGDVALITEIDDRDNYIIRKSINLSKEAHILAANVDQAYVLVTLHSPRTSMGFVDRLLVTCEAYHIPASIVINKADLYEHKDKDLDLLADFIDVYSSIGYEVIVVSALTGMNLDVLRKHMQDKICLFVGHSGSGKSSLINAIQPGLKLKTGDISAAHGKGKHTTTFAELHPLDASTWIVDTPGVKEFGIIDMEKFEIRNYFPEFRELAPECRFKNCLHLEEPGCAIKKGVEQGNIPPERYSSYLGLMNSEEIQGSKK